VSAYIQDANQSFKPLVAIVDDDESIRLATESLMRSIGYRTGSFASGEEFLIAEGLEEIQCLILDVKLGGMTGLAVQGQLVAADLHIPIVFITAHWNESNRAQALRLGAVDFLRKPCSETALLHAIDVALKVSQEARSAHIQ
jgi:FixJ family two-component response regulator